MNGLEERYGAQIDFFHLDVDQRITRDVMDRFGIRGRTEYVLLAADGTVVKKWFGYLNEGEIHAFLADYVSTLEAAPGS